MARTAGYLRKRAFSALTELARVWATRTAVSAETWHGYFNRAVQQIDILVYAGGFLVEALVDRN